MFEGYFTGELKPASPRLASAHAHQITTFETFFTYPGTDDLLLVLVADQSLLLEFVEKIDLAVGIHDLPVRIRSVGNDEVVRQGEYAFAVASAVSYVPFVGLWTLKLAGGVRILRDRETANKHGRRQQCTEQELNCFIDTHFFYLVLEIHFGSQPPAMNR